MMTKARFVLILYFLLPFCLEAIEPGKSLSQYYIRKWDKGNGYTAGAIYAVTRTREGYLWLGTGNGLARFDGVNFILYTTESHPGLKDNTIRSLLADGHNSLFVGTSSRGIFYLKDGRFEPVVIPGEKTFEKVYGINRDRQGKLWFGSNEGGLFFKGKERTGPFTLEVQPPDNRVSSIFKDAAGDLWVTTKTGIVKVSGTGQIQTVDLPGIDAPLLTCCAYNTGTGELWVGTGAQGIFRLKNGKTTKYGKEDGLPYNNISSLYLDRDNTVWIGTDGGGPVRFRNGKMERFTGDQGLSDSSVYAIYRDDEGNMWFGTIDHGLFQMVDGVFSTFTKQEGLPDDYVNCVFREPDGNLLIGTKKGVSRLSPGKDGEYPVLTDAWTTRDGLPDSRVLCIYKHPDHGLFIGTMGGLFRVKDGGSFIISKKDGLSDNAVNCVFAEPRGHVWIGTDKGLNRLDAGAGNIKTANIKTFSPGGGSMVEFIADGGEYGLFTGTQTGLYVYRGGDFTRAFKDTPLETHHFNCVYREKNRVFWFGTGKGLIRMKNWNTTFFSKKQGLNHDNIHAVVEDRNGFLWLGSAEGVMRVLKRDLETGADFIANPLKIRVYGKEDGMKSTWCTGDAIIGRDGVPWFPTAVGITAAATGKRDENAAAPTVIIEKMIVDGKVIDKLSKTWKGNTKRLPAGSEQIEFVYTGFCYANPRGLRFMTQLEGTPGGNWKPMGNQRSVVYPRLTYGTYVFNVSVYNSDNIKSPTPASITFSIAPYFHQTPWFYLFLGVFGISAFVLFYFLRVRQLKKRQKVLGQLVEERTRDLKERNLQLEEARNDLSQSKSQIEEKNRQLEDQSEKLKEMDRIKSRFFANISHEFRTPLTLIMGPLEQMLDQTGNETQKKKLNMMLRNSRRVLGLINQLLDLSRFESGAVKLRASRQNAVPYLRGIVSNFESLAGPGDLEMVFESAEQEVFVYIDAPKIEDVIGNLLINAVKFTPPGGRITVSLDKKPEQAEGFPHGFLRVSVSDTGPGIPREQLPFIFNRFYQTPGRFETTSRGTGIGLALVKELVSIHHGKIDVYSREGQGTQFIIQLPLGDSHLEPGEKIQHSESAKHTTVNHDHVTAPIEESENGIPDDEETGTTGGEKGIILVIDDSADIRRYIRDALEPAYTVFEAADGDEGLKKANEIIPDLVICDIMMPGKDGFELCRILKKDIKTSHIPVILLTAKASDDNIVQGLETGADDYITKPFNTAILIARIENLIQLRRQLQLTVNREMTFQPGKISVSSIDETFLKELKETIQKNISDPDFNVEQLSKLLYLDRSTVYRKVLALTGESPTEFIRSFRLKRGAELLKNNSGTVLEVALEVGFSSSNYFSKCFKKKFHQLPSSFQASESAE